MICTIEKIKECKKDKKKKKGHRKSWFELCKYFFRFATDAKYLLQSTNHTLKREIMRFIGSNFRLKDGKLLYELKKPFSFLENLKGGYVWWAKWGSNPRPYA